MRDRDLLHRLRTGALALGLCGVLAGCSLIGGQDGAGPAGQVASRTATPSKARPATPPATAADRTKPGATAGQPGPSGPGNPPFYEVFGQRYYVLPDSDGYRAKGVASWYGEPFHGRRTSSGEIYDMHGLTAAHKTLPLPSVVRVTNLDSGQSVVVTVNDRGPFVKDRIIDLSYAAAKQLGMVQSGTCNVEVQALSPVPPDLAAGAAPAAPATALATPLATSLATSLARTTASATPALPTRTPAHQLFMQVGAFGDQANARRLKERLELQGVDNVVIRHDDTSNPALYRVRIGPIANATAYDTLASRVESLRIANPQLVTESPAPP